MFPCIKKQENKFDYLILIILYFLKDVTNIKLFSISINKKSFNNILIKKYYKSLVYAIKYKKY